MENEVYANRTCITNKWLLSRVLTCEILAPIESKRTIQLHSISWRHNFAAGFFYLVATCDAANDTSERWPGELYALHTNWTRKWDNTLFTWRWNRATIKPDNGNSWYGKIVFATENVWEHFLPRVFWLLF